MAGENRWQSQADLSNELLRSAGLGRRRVVRGGLVGVEQVVAARASKAVLHSETGASAVDMESHIAADYAAAANLPFAALRVISDPANRSLPQMVATAIKPNGDIDLRRVLRGLARNPASIRSVISTGIDFNTALRSLRGCRSFVFDAVLGGVGLVAADL
jgi:adenosylhomocysteine nucleosidase